MQVSCSSCGKPRKNVEYKCGECGGIFDLSPDFKFRDKTEDNFPYVKEWVSLGEVTTPLVHKGKLHLKLDYFSPSFSYKDRGARVLISYLKSRPESNSMGGINEDSSGNAGGAIAAYGAAAGFDVNIFVPEKTSPAKVGQIKSYGANIVKVGGSREDVKIAAEMADGIYASHVMMPEFRDGIRTLSYEVFRQFHGKVPDNVFVPVSAGTLLLGVYSGFKHLLDSGEISRMPNIVAVQTEQVSPLCAKKSGRTFDPAREVKSIADALVSMKPPLIELMLGAIRDGSCITVGEEEIITARNDLAAQGIYCEFSSATVYAAYKKKKYDGESLLVLTGNGLKNPPRL